MFKRALLLTVLVAGCKSDKADAPTAPPAAPSASSSSTAPAAKTPQSASPRPTLPGDDAKAETADGSDRPRPHGRRMKSMDRDGDGVITEEERVAARHERMEGLIKRLDLNGDGKLTPQELSEASGRMHFDNPGELDVNHDGVISPEELQAATDMRRAQRRAARHGNAGTPTPNSAGSAAPAPSDGEN